MAGTVLWSGLPERDDPYPGTTNASNLVYERDERGPYLPCFVGTPHVHRGPLAAVDREACHCPHTRLMWMLKEHGLLMCEDCARSFKVYEGDDNTEYRKDIQ